MKLINHQKGNSYSLDSSVMRGTIEMTQEEYGRVAVFLTKKYYQANKLIDTYTRDSLVHIKNKQEALKGNLFSLGVVASRLIAQNYSIPRYKQQNYGIKITK